MGILNFFSSKGLSISTSNSERLEKWKAKYSDTINRPSTEEEFKEDLIKAKEEYLREQKQLKNKK